MNQTVIALKLLNGIYQLTRLNLRKDANGAVCQPLEITAPIYNENRTCKAVFYKKNKANRWFYKEIDEDNKLTFA